MPDYRKIADGLVEELAPFCERIAIVGSVRRGVERPHDIELLMVPRTEQYQVAGQLSLDGAGATYATRNLLDAELDRWRADGRLGDRKGKDGRRAWGERYKRALLFGERGDDVALDLFSCVSPASWGCLMAIRTGPAEFSHLLVTSRLFKGVLPLDMQVKGGHLERGGVAVDTPEESSFFDAIGVPRWPPEDREAWKLLNWHRREGAVRA